MVAKLLLMGALASYILFRIGFTLAAIRADRRGDIERGRELRAKGFRMTIGSLVFFLVLASVAAVVGIAASHGK
jgi:hypothetical protein